MNNTIHVGDITITKEFGEKLAVDELDHLLLNGYPFVKRDMTVLEYILEKKYYGENYSNVLDGTYVPLWKQKKHS